MHLIFSNNEAWAYSKWSMTVAIENDTDLFACFSRLASPSGRELTKGPFQPEKHHTILSLGRRKPFIFRPKKFKHCNGKSLSLLHGTFQISSGHVASPGGKKKKHPQKTTYHQDKPPTVKTRRVIGSNQTYSHSKHRSTCQPVKQGETITWSPFLPIGARRPEAFGLLEALPAFPTRAHPHVIHPLYNSHSYYFGRPRNTFLTM